MTEAPEVRLEPQTPDHAEGLFAVLADPRVHSFLDSDPPPDVEAVRDRILRLMTGGPPDGSETWLNWTVFQGDRIAGTTQATIQPPGTAILAYILSPEVWGTGIARRAAELTMRELKECHAVSRLVADTETGNLASQGLLRKLGFSETHRAGNDIHYARAL